MSTQIVGSKQIYILPDKTQKPIHLLTEEELDHAVDFTVMKTEKIERLLKIYQKRLKFFEELSTNLLNEHNERCAKRIREEEGVNTQAEEIHSNKSNNLLVEPSGESKSS